jgi:hypothetical protein
MNFAIIKLESYTTSVMECTSFCYAKDITSPIVRDDILLGIDVIRFH